MNDCIGEGCDGGVPFWGGIDTTSYKIFLAIHVLAVIAAFGPPLLFAVFNREASKRRGETAQVFAALPLVVSKRISFPSFLVAAFTGIVLVLDSSSVFTFQKPWISAAFSIVILIALVYWFMLWPAQRRLMSAAGSSDGSDVSVDSSSDLRSARTSAGVATGLVHIGMVALVILMIWKPGQ